MTQVHEDPIFSIEMMTLCAFILGVEEQNATKISGPKQFININALAFIKKLNRDSSRILTKMKFYVIFV